MIVLTSLEMKRSLDDDWKQWKAKKKEAGMISYEERRQLFLQKSTINIAKRGTRGTFCSAENGGR